MPFFNIDDEHKSFRLPAVIKARQGKHLANVHLPPTVAQADTGSDMSVITIGLINHLDLPVYPLSSKGFSGLTMNVANGTSSSLTHFTTFNIGVLGVWRSVDAFVRPWRSKDEKDLHLLLGLPYLWDVNAKMHIRESIIELGDETIEKTVRIKGPEFVPGKSRKLILHPISRNGKERAVEDDVEESDSDESDEDCSDSESDFSDDQIISEEVQKN